jgi:hypothetical protein
MTAPLDGPAARVQTSREAHASSATALATAAADADARAHASAIAYANASAVLRRQRAIARSRERRAADLAPLRAEVDRLVSEVGWERARPIVEAVMAPVRVSGPRGVWRSRVGKRTGRRILAELAALPVQERFALSLSQPSRRAVPTPPTPPSPPSPSPAPTPSDTLWGARTGRTGVSSARRLRQK